MTRTKSTLFNTNFDKLGYKYVWGNANPSKAQNEILLNKTNEVISRFCEELMLFDKVVLKADSINYALYFLIKEFGFKSILTFLETGLIEIAYWEPYLVTSTGRQRADGSVDESVIYGQPPLVVGWTPEDKLDIEKNTYYILSYFDLTKDQKYILTREIRTSFIKTNKDFGFKAAELAIDAFSTGKLDKFGLKNNKPPEQLNPKERLLLQGLGQDILETSFLAQNNFKSLNNFEYFEISKKSFDTIGNALKVNSNANSIFKIENVPDIYNLFLSKSLKKEDLKHLRTKPSVKELRKWLNEKTVDFDCEYLTKEYLNEVTGKNNYWASNKGKFIKSLGMNAVGSALGVAIGGLNIQSASAGALIPKVAELGLGLFDTYVLDGLINGKNPRLFIEEVRKKNELKDS